MNLRKRVQEMSVEELANAHRDLWQRIEDEVQSCSNAEFLHRYRRCFGVDITKVKSSVMTVEECESSLYCYPCVRYTYCMDCALDHNVCNGTGEDWFFKLREVINKEQALFYIRKIKDAKFII